jgi:mRNA interferase HigB
VRHYENVGSRREVRMLARFSLEHFEVENDFAICEHQSEPFRGNSVRVISRKKLKNAASTHAEASASLDAWYRITKRASWKSLADLRLVWSSADLFGDCTIFNIKGTKYRLIVWINYQTQKVFIRHVLSHAEYSKGVWKNDCTGGK